MVLVLGGLCGDFVLGGWCFWSAGWVVLVFISLVVCLGLVLRIGDRPPVWCCFGVWVWVRSVGAYGLLGYGQAGFVIWGLAG